MTSHFVRPANDRFDPQPLAFLSGSAAAETGTKAVEVDPFIWNPFILIMGPRWRLTPLEGQGSLRNFSSFPRWTDKGLIKRAAVVPRRASPLSVQERRGWERRMRRRPAADFRQISSSAVA